MDNPQKDLKTLLANERNNIAVPLRGEFRVLLDAVTNVDITRNITQKGIVSPFRFFIAMTKNKLVLAGSLALLAIIVIVPTVRYANRSSSINQDQYIQATDLSSDAQAQAIVQSAQGTVSQDIVSDILTDFAQEDALVQQEYANDAVVDDYTFDEATITN